MFQTAKIFPVAKEGIPFIFRFVAAGAIFSFIPFNLCRILGFAFFLLAVFCVFFFRDPERIPIQDPSFILAPGDGTVLEVSEDTSSHLNGKVYAVKIFLSIFDVHVQRAPISGKVVAIEYLRGKFWDARDSRASLENEQNAIVIENEKCKVVVKQIAGFIARRIACWVRPGQSLALGQRLGLIRFGSQVDIMIPKEAKLCVKAGEKVTSGMSVIAIFPTPVGEGIKQTVAGEGIIR